MLGRFGYGLMDVSYFFCVFFLGKRNNVGISLVKKTPSWCPSPVSRPFLPSQSLLHHLVAYLVGSGFQGLSIGSAEIIIPFKRKRKKKGEPKDELTEQQTQAKREREKRFLPLFFRSILPLQLPPSLPNAK